MAADYEGPGQDPWIAHPAPGGARLFTVAEANRLLPTLRVAVLQARAHLAEMRAAHREMQQIEAIGKTPAGDWILAADHRAAARRLQQHHAACRRAVARILAAGCQLKDLDSGICDFPAIIDGQPVLLCWQVDEPAIAHYHTLDGGYAGRRPLPPGTP